MEKTLLRTLAVITLIWMLFDIYRVLSPKKFCRDFVSREQVNIYYYGDTIKYKHLDRDRDNVPCEAYNYGRNI